MMIDRAVRPPWEISLIDYANCVPENHVLRPLLDFLRSQFDDRDEAIFLLLLCYFVPQRGNTEITTGSNSGDDTAKLKEVTGRGVARHVLLEGPPGTGKSELVGDLHEALYAYFHPQDPVPDEARILGTPETLPSDFIGRDSPAGAPGAFEFIPGPLLRVSNFDFSKVHSTLKKVLTKLFVVDEINRLPPKTRDNTLLEVMQQNRVTLSSLLAQRVQTTARCQGIFIVAAQNPSYFRGVTGPLGEALADRFMCRVGLRHPFRRTMANILGRHLGDSACPLDLDSLQASRGWKDDEIRAFYEKLCVSHQLDISQIRMSARLSTAIGATGLRPAFKPREQQLNELRSTTSKKSIEHYRKEIAQQVKVRFEDWAEWLPSLVEVCRSPVEVFAAHGLQLTPTRRVRELIDGTVDYGFGTRGDLALADLASVLAWSQGKSEVTRDHLMTLAPYVLNHRITFTKGKRQTVYEQMQFVWDLCQCVM